MFLNKGISEHMCVKETNLSQYYIASPDHIAVSYKKTLCSMCEYMCLDANDRYACIARICTKYILICL